MPVESWPVHPRTVERPDAKYGCHNRPPFKDGYYAMERRYNPDGTFHLVLVFIPHTMTTDCQQAATGQAKGDRKCAGCMHMKGE